MTTTRRFRLNCKQAALLRSANSDAAESDAFSNDADVLGPLWDQLDQAAKRASCTGSGHAYITLTNAAANLLYQVIVHVSESDAYLSDEDELETLYRRLDKIGQF